MYAFEMQSMAPDGARVISLETATTDSMDRSAILDTTTIPDP